MLDRITKSELSVDDLLEIAWKIFWQNQKEILKIWATFAVAIGIFSRFIFETIQQTVVQKGDISPFLWTFFAMSILIGFLSLLFVISLTFLTNSFVKSSPMTYGDTLRRSFTKLWSVLWTSVLLSILLIFLGFAFIIPLFIFAVYWGFSVYAVILRDVSGLSALRYSKKIVEGRWWKTFGMFFLIGIVGFVAQAPINFVFGFLIDKHILPNNIVTGVITGAVQYYVSLFFMVANIVLFLNFEATRKNTDN